MSFIRSLGLTSYQHIMSSILYPTIEWLRNKQVTRATSSLGFSGDYFNSAGFDTPPECQYFSRQRDYLVCQCQIIYGSPSALQSKYMCSLEISGVECLSKQWLHFDGTEYHPNRRKHDARRHLKLSFQRIAWWSLTTHATPKLNSSLLSKCLHFAEYEFFKICVNA